MFLIKKQSPAHAANTTHTHTPDGNAGPLSAQLMASSQLVEQGKSVTLNCSIQGFPVQSVIFKHNNVVIKPNYDRNIKYLNDNVIIVDKVDRHHAGSYQCFVYNQYESVQATSFIALVDDPPVFREIFTPKIVEQGEFISTISISTLLSIVKLTVKTLELLTDLFYCYH